MDRAAPHYIDLHCHILPGVDDGAADMEQALLMARELVAAGFSIVAASPHTGTGPGGDVSIAVAAAIREELQGALRAEGIGLDLLPNAEHHLTAEMLTRIVAGDVIPVGGRSRWLMIELPWGGLADTEGVLFRIQTRGLRVLLAHPERCMSLELDVLERLVRRGVRNQVELGSFIGHFGIEEERRARSMLSRGLVHVLATDLHAAAHADEWIPAALRAVGKRAIIGVEDNPRGILDDASPDAIVPL